MASHLLLLCLLQQLAVDPYPAEVGERVQVVVRGVPAVAGQSIEVVLPDGSARAVGVTDANGAIAFVPEVVGAHRFVATLAARRTVAPLQVIPARRRWLYAALCVPVGLVLGFATLRRWRRGPASS